jgi:hypothetical protein
LLALAGAAACGGSETPRSTRTTTVTPLTTATPAPTPSPTKESALTGPTVVAARQLSDDSRVLVAYDLDDGTTRELATLQREDHPTVDATGTSVVVQQYTGTAEAGKGPWGRPGTGAHLVLIDLATGARQRLTATTEGVFDQDAVWNRDGDGLVYFVRWDPNGHRSLWRVDPSSDEVEQAPHGDGVSQFVLEPGGRTAWVQGGWGTGGAWRLDLATGSVTRHPFDPMVGGDLAWTPDGTWLAYSEHWGGVPTASDLLVERWPDGTPRTLMSTGPEKVGATTWHAFPQVGWEPEGSTVIVQDTRYSWDTPWDNDSTRVEQRILLVDTAGGSTTPIGPASVNDLSFDVWAPPATS